MEGHGAGEKQHRDEPSGALAAADPPGEREQADARKGDEGAGGLAQAKWDVAEQRMEAATQLRWHDGRDEVGETQDRDAGCGEPAYAALTADRVGDRRPDEAAGKGSDDFRLAAGVRQPSRREALQQGHRSQVCTGEEEPCVHLGPRLDLDPRHLLEMDEDRWQAETGRPLLDHLAARARVGIEPGSDARELGLEGVARDEAGAAGGKYRARRLPGAVVGPVRRRAEQRAAGRMPDAVVDNG